MNIIKKGVIVCTLALSQILLNSTAIAFSENYSTINQEQFSEAELAQILAPIALYPDSLLSHIVIASTYPIEVVEAHRWREQNSNLDAAEAVNLAEDQGWDPSIASLVAFPSVLARLSEDLQWTQNLGDAFLEDEGRVLNTIQLLRQQAQQANSLNNMHNMKVSTINKQIVIEPVYKEIVYVPYYNTRVIYGTWLWNRHPPIYWERPHLSVHFPSKIATQFHWSSGINISFNYFFSAFEWRSRHVVVTNHRNARKYRSYGRIAISNGAKRWQHKPSHRRGVAYRSNKLNKDFGRPQRGYSHNKRTLSNHRNQTAFTRKLKDNNQHRSVKAKKNRLANNTLEYKDKKRLQSQRKEGGQNKYVKHGSLKNKLTRNNRSDARNYKTNEGRINNGNAKRKDLQKRSQINESSKTIVKQDQIQRKSETKGKQQNNGQKRLRSQNRSEKSNRISRDR